MTFHCPDCGDELEPAEAWAMWCTTCDRRITPAELAEVAS